MTKIKDEELKEKIIGKVILSFIAFIMFLYGFLICDGTWWKELILSLLLLSGHYIQGLK